MLADAPSGQDPQRVEALVVLVQVAEGQAGLALSEEHLGPLRLFDQHACKSIQMQGGFRNIKEIKENVRGPMAVTWGHRDRGLASQKSGSLTHRARTPVKDRE